MKSMEEQAAEYREEADLALRTIARALHRWDDLTEHDQ